jgi:hypothetical protein
MGFTELETPKPADEPIVSTEKGYIVRGFDTCEVGDVICVLFGCAMPVILRSVDT